MTAIEQAIAQIVAEQVAQAEKRIMERLVTANDRDLSFSEACDYLNMSSYSLKRLCSAKKIPHRVVGSPGSKNPRYWFSLAGLEQWKRAEEAKNYQPSQ